MWDGFAGKIYRSARWLTSGEFGKTANFFVHNAAPARPVAPVDRIRGEAGA
jgi:hypothetical protein